MPDIILADHTSIGQEVAPRLAFRLKTRLITDCIDLAIDPDSMLLLQTKMVYGGNALAVYTSELKPQMATIRAKTMSPIERDDSRKGNTIRFDPRIDASSIRTELIERVKEEKKEIGIEDADIVISGGRGIGSREGFSQLKELDRLLNGAYGGSRPPCDLGWVPSSHQVGLTGKIIAPSLYIAVGISGATQHIVGISGAKKIVAINKDPNANIFRVADYGVIGDYREVLPSLIEKVRELASE
jgi:electron transfer flavoprotein alpha subunit